MRVFIYSLPGEIGDAVHTAFSAAKYSVYNLKALKTTNISHEDLLVTWTLWDEASRTKMANKFYDAGARVICIERGWLRGKGHYQIAWRVGKDCGYNGWGQFPAGDGSRWAQMGFELKPWTTGGDYVLICGNKGDTYSNKYTPQINHTSEWVDDIVDMVRKNTDKPVYFRPHPKSGRGLCVPVKNLPDKIINTSTETLSESLERAVVTVVWASSTASQSICAGVPVIYRAQKIMLHELATRDITLINNPPTPDRLPVLERCAWAQWTEPEIRKGLPFKHLGLW